MRPLEKSTSLYKIEDAGLIERAYYERYRLAYVTWSNAPVGTEEFPFKRAREWGEYVKARDTYLDFVSNDEIDDKKKVNLVNNEKPFFNA